MPIGLSALTAASFTEIGVKAVMDLSNYTKNTTTFKSELKSMTDFVDKFAKSISGKFEESTEEVNKLGDMFHRVVSIVGGIVIADMFRGFNRAIGDVVGQTLEAVDTFQKLEIQLETIVARDFAVQNQIPVQEAFAKTSGLAEDLLNWVTQVAVQTPFSAQSVGKVLAMGQAYGFSTDMAQRMVMTVGDFTASMGAGNEVLERIIYNLGQMSAAGRPTGRELRDLANNFVPINQIADRFAEKMQISRAEVLDLFREGKIAASEFIEEFLLLVEETVPGAMMRLSRTFQTVRTNLQDLIQIMLGFRLLGPIANQVAEDLQEMLESLMTDRTADLMDSLGQALLFSYTKMGDIVSKQVQPAFSKLFSTLGGALPTIDNMHVGILRFAAGFTVLNKQMAEGASGVADFIQRVLNYFGTSFEQIKVNMQTWGKNIVLSFAQGMASAISAVIQVINFIGQAISRLLKSNSPPLLLPDLEVWGANAMLAYMEGWRNADFSVFDDIGNILESAIESWEGKIGAEAVIFRILGSKKALADIIEEYRNFGTISSSAMANLTNVIGIASEHIDQFIRKSLELTDVVSIREAVQDLWDFEDLVPVNIFGEVVDSFQDIVDLAGRFGDELSQSIINYARSSERLVYINEEIARTQEEINQSTEKYDDLIASLTAQLNRVKDRSEDISRIAQIDRTLKKVILTATERERLELEKEQILLERQIRIAKEQRDAEEKVGDAKLDALKDEKDEVEAKLKQEKKYINEVSEANVQALENELKALEDIINAQIELNELINRQVNIKLSGGGGSDISGLTDDLEDLIDQALLDATEALDIEAELQAMWDEILKQAEDFWKEIEEPFLPLGDLFENALQTWKDVIEDPTFQAAWTNFTTQIDEGLKILTDFWDRDGESILKAIGDLLGGIFTNLFITTEATGKSVLELLGDLFISFANTIDEHGEDITSFLNDFSTFINETTFDKIKEFLAIGDFASTAAPIILKLLTFIVDNADTLIKVFIASRLLNAASGEVSNQFKKSLTLERYTEGFKSLSILVPLVAIGIGEIAKKGKEFLEGKGVGTFFDGVKESFKGIFTGDMIEEKQILGPIDWKATGEAISTWWNEDVKSIFTGDMIEEKQIIEPIDWEATGEAISTWWDKLFGENGTLVTGQNQSQQQMATWAQDTYGTNSELNTQLQLAGTNLETWWNTNFGEGGIVPTWYLTSSGQATEWIMGIFGDEGSVNTWMKQAGLDIESWWSTNFGEGGTVPTWYMTSTGNATDWIMGIFGEEGVVNTWMANQALKIGEWWEGLFGEGGSVTLWFSTSFTDFETWIKSIFGEEGVIMTWLKTAETDIENWWNGLFGEDGTISGWFDTVITNFSTFGENLIQGIIDGIAAKASNLFTTVKDVVKDALGIAEAESKTESPSKKYMELGKNWMKGLEQGVRINAILIDDVMKDIVGSSLEAIKIMQTMQKMFIMNPSTINPLSGSTVVPAKTTYNHYTTAITVNPTYENYASPASIYYDVSAALASSRR